MINPLTRAAAIIDTDPQLAEPLFDLLVFVVEVDDPRHNSQVDRVLEMVYARTEDSLKHRQIYERKRLSVAGDSRETVHAPLEV